MNKKPLHWIILSKSVIFNIKKTILITLLVLLALLAEAQYQRQVIDNDHYLNPIFAGDYPDPSILRDDDTYYMVHSSFEYYPGLLIWKSKDLINWSPVANALHKYLGSVWAPDLAKYKDKFYIYFPANNKIYVVWANKIEGPWSDPIDLKINNIDPGHVIAEDGKRYLYSANGGYVPLSEDGLSVIGETRHVYDGWKIPREWSIECFCLEGPKITKRGEYYYLTVAEGGTAGPATGHMIVSARSKSPLGPWENSPFNPIERTLSNTERWWSKGHGTLFEDANGDWWMIFHGYESGFYNFGRQTLLQPVEWTADGWFKTPANIKTDQPIKKPALKQIASSFSLSDHFDENTLNPNWKFFGEYDTNRFKVENNSLVMKAKGNSLANSSPLLCIPSDHSYTVDVEMNIEGKATGALLLFYNNSHNSGILADGNNILANINGWQFVTENNVHNGHVFLRLKNINNTIDMYYSIDGVKWIKIENSIEVSSMQHNVLGGFLSLRIGLCSFGDGTVVFKNFHYKPIK